MAAEPPPLVRRQKGTHVIPDYEEVAVRFRQLCEGLAEMRGYL